MTKVNAAVTRDGAGETRPTTVSLPNMFRTFLEPPPVLNPSYESVRAESEQWLNELFSFSPKMAREVAACDFSYFAAITAPHAPPERLRVVCDWGNWVFHYDDLFDNAQLQSDEAKSLLKSLLDPMLGRPVSADRPPVVRAHDLVFMRVCQGGSAGIQKRYVRSMQAYGAGAIAHLNDELAGRRPSLEELAATRRLSVGASPLYHLVEYAHDINVPDDVFDSPAIQELQELGVDMVSICNDIVSYRKERAEGVPHNMVVACERNGLSAQEAMDTVGRFLEERYRRWDVVEALVPSWGEQTDKEVRRYLDGIKAVVRANLYWSFKTDRYFGPDGDQVRRTRSVEIMPDGPVRDRDTAVGE